MTHTPDLRLRLAEVTGLWLQKCFAAQGYLYLPVLAHRTLKLSDRIQTIKTLITGGHTT